MLRFKLVSKFKPAGGQPQAIKQLTRNILAGERNQVFLGVTGSGKTFSISNIIEKTQLPTLWVSHNKTLAAQTYQELKEFFPNNAVHYFVSYYDYYQPEAYLPASDTYIEKDAKINEEIDRLRHAAVQDLIQRKDVIVVASVSCIYNIGSPQEYQNVSLEIKQGQKIKRQEFLRHLVALQYQRNDYEFRPGAFRARGEVVEIYLVTGEKIVRLEFFGDRIEKIFLSEPSLSTNYKLLTTNYRILPAKFWVSEEEKIKIAITNIQNDLQARLAELKKQGKSLEAQRLEQRTNYDLEMIQTAGYCSGIENYSRYFEFRKPSAPPFTLLDYFPFAYPHNSCENSRHSYLTIIDESHITIPQLHAMYNTDKARKNILIDYGFRLPSCLDNRPLKFEEFKNKIQQAIYVSATPGPYEIDRIKKIWKLPSNFHNLQGSCRATSSTSNSLLVEQLVRPTGLLEPSVEIRPTKNQIQNLVKEIKKAKAKNERVLAITLTKRMAEELTSYLKEQAINAQYLHSEIKTLERPKILNKLRQGEYEAIIGINLLREGLDLPEVALVVILDADKEGFLRNETTLIQTMGRAARHINGRVILYGDKITGSMKSAICEVARRRKIQLSYNKKHSITPQAIIKKIRDWPFAGQPKGLSAEFGAINDIKILEKEMQQAAVNLNFERAAEIRDLIKEIKSDKNKVKDAKI
ncbi:excinuclease ABC subunit UvrB [bacterium (Candidatus Gribaldobacteria) CG08_land_8_20_14_0_20_39_15]|uniref:UvrABC system protein B n=1 Tax=bacterium (Candidatus Gribaldobacteria) CG08_land_8_20_14_0_20_39_15 TaxID=2014273 RepID=A0A2M6XU08_9BACT|nr:MAG: excinuclease ABC subunit UvrB [bacterium (Candidatus Gribaldobacteria) CG08_land_8_20_14_0_20_39_15]